ncbi:MULTISPECIES: NAD(+) synthase [unclassified Bradyrhizobium]|uniref:NAD(+) synthase n=1 Tax=unclassified Bradyrhizobium TaxID=2631580 RepID=UPI0020B2F204|nr:MULTISPECIES: NAD(+) synthase [unclassified Bradyrhizobium]MCP3398633.1 NAD(+) synthase [Bradyrhizobium sp. CCGB20]MCP3407212.1 NAD(+) synthase [Bradyrhizobium sp. CCGB01]
MTLQVAHSPTERAFSKDALVLDAPEEVARIVAFLRDRVLGALGRRGAIVGLSGGIDSSVVAALCARAFGNTKVLGLLMPERDSSADSMRLGMAVAAQLRLTTVVEHIAPALEALGAYRRQREAIQTVVPQYDDDWKCKLVLGSILERNGINITRLTVQDPNGETSTVRLPPEVYLQIVAATNYKQRVRKMTEYYHADRLKYAVIGTPNRLEHDQGFFVKQGDGDADVMPIAHLYKSQVYQLAEYLGVDEEIRQRPPTSDTFSLPQSQEEFYFAAPYRLTDVCMYAVDHGISADDVAEAVGLAATQVQKVFKDITSKRRATRYLHTRPLLVDAVIED